ncbi:DUF3826 domain-containing protein [Longitalea luteola]|uniref:DUF3826 domain-containing protein n=1 Tax=Longitalea luteola TaxID=2812563 RepID=UPI001A96531B|nr:DUF3826 domain-containing protein [Longitalea luteola]
MKFLPFTIALCFLLPFFSRAQADSSKIAEATAKANAEAAKKAAEWSAGLKLTDGDKEKRVTTAITAHLIAIRDWNNTHPFTTVPAGINPATGNKLSELDRQIIANSAMPASIHKDLMDVLNKELTPEQVEYILDQYTIGKVAFTLKGYQAIVPDLKPEEEKKILEYLKQAREQAIDYKSMKQISAIFEIYKTKCEQYLNNNGRNWRQLFKAYVDKVKAEKAKNKK